MMLHNLSMLTHTLYLCVHTYTSRVGTQHKYYSYVASGIYTVTIRCQWLLLTPKNNKIRINTSISGKCVYIMAKNQ